MPKQVDSRLVLGFESSDDAAVIELDEHRYLINTVDFFTPIYNDPYVFGQIASANALSDIYAMGGTVLNCLNILSFPSEVDEKVISEILRGAYDKVIEANGVIAGGHTISTDHIIYGLSVNGFVEKSKLKTNSGALPNQKLILTKKLGTGIYAKEINLNKDASDCQEVITSMITLNKKTSEIMHKYRVSAVTDVTGFGLIGHLCEIAQASNVSITVYMDTLPLFDRTRELALIYPNGGMKRNFSHFGKHVQIDERINTQANINILFDPQTSGGLLIVVDNNDAEELLNELHNEGINAARIIGETDILTDKFIKVK